MRKKSPFRNLDVAGAGDTFPCLRLHMPDRLVFNDWKYFYRYFYGDGCGFFAAVMHVFPQTFVIFAN